MEWVTYFLSGLLLLCSWAIKKIIPFFKCLSGSSIPDQKARELWVQDWVAVFLTVKACWYGCFYIWFALLACFGSVIIVGRSCSRLLLLTTELNTTAIEMRLTKEKERFCAVGADNVERTPAQRFAERAILRVVFGHIFPKKFTSSLLAGDYWAVGPLSGLPSKHSIAKLDHLLKTWTQGHWIYWFCKLLVVGFDCAMPQAQLEKNTNYLLGINT